MDRLVPATPYAQPLPAGTRWSRPDRGSSPVPTYPPARLRHSAFFAEPAPGHRGRRNTGDRAQARKASIVFYDRGAVRVTDTHVETADGRFLLARMHSIHRVETFSYPARKVALICSALELGMAALLAVHYGVAILVCGGMVNALAIGLAIVIDGRRNPRWMALRGTYAGKTVTIFSSRNQQEFEAVRRAIVRAVEAVHGSGA